MPTAHPPTSSSSIPAPSRARPSSKARRIVRPALAANPVAVVLVTGCYAQVEAEALAALDERVLVLPGEDKEALLGLPAWLGGPRPATADSSRACVAFACASALGSAPRPRRASGPRSRPLRLQSRVLRLPFAARAQDPGRLRQRMRLLPRSYRARDLREPPRRRSPRARPRPRGSGPRGDRPHRRQSLAVSRRRRRLSRPPAASSSRGPSASPFAFPPTSRIGSTPPSSRPSPILACVPMSTSRSSPARTRFSRAWDGAMAAPTSSRQSRPFGASGAIPLSRPTSSRAFPARPRPMPRDARTRARLRFRLDTRLSIFAAAGNRGRFDADAACPSAWRANAPKPFSVLARRAGSPMSTAG